MDKNIKLAMEIMCSPSYSMMSISNTELCLLLNGDDQVIVSKYAYKELQTVKEAYKNILHDNHNLLKRLTK